MSERSAEPLRTPALARRTGSRRNKKDAMAINWQPRDGKREARERTLRLRKRTKPRSSRDGWIHHAYNYQTTYTGSQDDRRQARRGGQETWYWEKFELWNSDTLILQDCMQRTSCYLVLRPVIRLVLRSFARIGSTVFCGNIDRLQECRFLGI